MTEKQTGKGANSQEHMPEAETIAAELATFSSQRKWTRPLRNWPQVFNQQEIRFPDRVEC